MALFQQNAHFYVQTTLQISQLATQYDEAAKKLLAQKIVVAYILKRILDDFKDMNPKDIIPCIEGEPQVGVVPVDPGLPIDKIQEITPKTEDEICEILKLAKR